MTDDPTPLHVQCFDMALRLSIATARNPDVEPMPAPEWFTVADYLRAGLAFIRDDPRRARRRMTPDSELCLQVATAALDNALTAELGGGPGLRDQYLTSAARELQTALRTLTPAPATSAIPSPGHDRLGPGGFGGTDGKDR